MKKRLAALMAAVCLMFFAGNVITTQAAVNAVQLPCDECGAPTIQHGEHAGHWYTTVNVILLDGSVGKCTEFVSIDRTYYTCTVDGHTFHKDYESRTHSVEHK